MDSKDFRSLRVYQLAYELAMEIFRLSKSFPKDELYSLTAQIRRSARSICANIAEGYRKRQYPNHFASKMSDADSECSETTIWLDFANDCGYINKSVHNEMRDKYNEVGRMLGGMIAHPEKFKPKR